jgi:hypothetical protein
MSSAPPRSSGGRCGDDDHAGIEQLREHGVRGDRDAEHEVVAPTLFAGVVLAGARLLAHYEVDLMNEPPMDAGQPLPVALHNFRIRLALRRRMP